MDQSAHIPFGAERNSQLLARPESAAATSSSAEPEGRTDSGSPRISRGILRLLLFFSLFVLGAYGLDAAIKQGLKRVRTSEIGALNRAMAGRVNTEIIISGSSRALVQYDPQIIAEATGRSAYNIGRNASRIDVQFAFLKAYLKHNSKPRLVVQNLDFHTFSLTHDGIPDPPFYAPYLGEDELYQGFRKINPDVWKWRYVPLYCFAVEDSSYAWLVGLGRLAGYDRREDFILGYHPRHRSWTDEFDRWREAHPAGASVDYEPGGVEAFKDLIGLCQQEGIQVVLVFSPVYHPAVPLINNRTEVFDQFKAIAQQFDVPFWDYSEAPITDHQELFYNSQHLNDKGAALFSRSLGERLAEFIAVKGWPKAGESRSVADGGETTGGVK